MNSPKKIFFCLCLIYSAGASFLAYRFPPLSSDEVVRAVIGIHRVQGQTARYSLYDDIFAQPVYQVRDVLPDTLLSLYHTWLGMWTYLQDSGYFLSRASSIAAGLLALLAFYRLGLLIGGTRESYIYAALVLSCPIFLVASCIARPETLLLFTSVSLLWLSQSWKTSTPWKHLLLGTLTALQGGIHANASIIGIGILVITFLNEPLNNRLKTIFLFLVGGLSGLTMVLLLTDIQRLWLGLQTVHAFLLRPPIVRWPWNPWDWFTKTISVMWNGQTYYFDFLTSMKWVMGLRLWWISMSLLLILSAYQTAGTPHFSQWRKRFMALLAVFIASLFLVEARDCIYGTNFLPFLIPLIAPAISTAPKKVIRNLSIICLIMMGSSLYFFFGFCRLYILNSKPYTQIMNELTSILPDNQLKIVGPSVLWFGLGKNKFRDIGALQVSRWYMNGERDFENWLKPWEPDIIILDNVTKKSLNIQDKNFFDSSIFTNCSATLLGSLDSKKSYGQWDIYRLRWAKPSDKETVY